MKIVMDRLNKICFLKNPIMEYEWGSKTALQEFVREEGYIGRKAAEVWMGAHPKASSLVRVNSHWISLHNLIDMSPEDILGKSTARRFSGKLPFLFKIIAVDKPLSLQVHPNQKQAVEGFSRENLLGIPVNSPERNYKDANKKPELICSLNHFNALVGFRKAAEIERLVETLLPSLGTKPLIHVKDLLERGKIENSFKKILRMNKTDQKKLVESVMETAHDHEDETSIYKLISDLNREYPGDVCVLAPLFLNLIKLNPGQATYVRSGEIHCYLYGVAIELMTSSDNVVRGGLTVKHVDTEGLIEIIDFSTDPPAIISPDRNGGCESIYPVLFEEFQLSLISVKDRMEYKSQLNRSAEIVLCIKGEAIIKGSGDDALHLIKGHSVIVPASVADYRIYGDSVLYKASVP